MDGFKISKVEQWDFTSEGPQFMHTIVFAAGPYDVKRISIAEREDEIDLDSVDWASAIPVPVEDVWPEPGDLKKQYTGKFTGETYLKDSDLQWDMLKQTSQTAADLILAEAGVLESHFCVSHPNIEQYLGYLLGPDERIRGLCFKRYRETLLDRLEIPADPWTQNAA